MAYAVPVVAASQSNITVSNPNITSLDGVTLANPSRIVLTGQTAPKENGVWLWTGKNVALTRPVSPDQYATTNTLDNAVLIWVQQGNTYAGTVWGVDPAQVVKVDTTSHTLTRVVLPPVQARACTTGASGTVHNVTTYTSYTSIDGVTLLGNGLAGSDIVVVNDQALSGGAGAASNGLYWANSSGAMARCTEPLIPGRAVIVGGEGAGNAHAQFVLAQQGNIINVGPSGTAIGFARQNVINVQDFGADPSASAATNAAAFVAAIAAAKAAGGGIIGINAGTFAMTPNSIVLNGNNIILQGAGIFSTTLSMNAIGTGIKVYTAPGPGSGVFSQGCGVNDLNVLWAGAGPPWTGGAIGIDLTGAEFCNFNRIAMRMPVSAQSYGFYVGTVTSSAAAADWNQINDSVAFGPAFTGDYTNYAAIGIYFPYNTGSGGANSNAFSGMVLDGWNRSIAVEYGFGNKFLDIDSELATVCHVSFGGPGTGNGSASGNRVDFRYAEQVNTAYMVRFEVSSNPTILNTGNVIEVGYWNNQVGSVPSTGVTIPGLIDPTNSPVVGNNRIDVWGARHGTLSLYYPGSHNAANIGHYNTADRQLLLPDASGDLPLRAPGQAASGGASLAALTADFNALLTKLRSTGVIDSYSPQTDGAVCWLRADNGIVRSGTPATWTDIIGGVSFTCHNMGYRDQIAGSHLRSALSFNAVSSYATGTLASAVTACSIFVVAQILDVTGNDGLIEITPAGVINTGVAIERITSNDKARRLTSDANVASSVAGTGWHLFEATFANASGDMYIDDANHVADGSAQTLVASGAVCIGALGGGASYFLNGWVAEVIIFPSAVSSGVRANVHSYVQTRYGTP